MNAQPATETPNYNLKFILDDFEFGLQRLLDGIEAYVNGVGKLRPSKPRRRPRR